MNTDWENEFEKWTYWKAKCGNPLCTEMECYIDGIKDFIRTQLSLAEKRGQEKAVKFIEENSPICDFDNYDLIRDVEITTLEQAKSL